MTGSADRPLTLPGETVATVRLAVAVGDVILFIAKTSLLINLSLGVHFSRLKCQLPIATIPWNYQCSDAGRFPCNRQGSHSVIRPRPGGQGTEAIPREHRNNDREVQFEAGALAEAASVSLPPFRPASLPAMARP